jgi:putative ABC transport system ATP-binding protein
MHAVEAVELYKFFHAGDEEVRALRGVDLVLEAGEMAALIGPSGSGKSTLLHCLAGLEEPDGGMVRVMGEPMTRHPEAHKARLRSKFLGVMLQGNNLFSHLTVSENIKMMRSLCHANGEDATDALLRDIGLATRASSLPAELSGGERARAGLAAAMACEPKILLLDEPTGEVDAAAEKAILSALDGFCGRGGAVLVATHNHAVAHKASRVVLMKDGKTSDG